MEIRHLDVVPGLEGVPAAESSISFIDGEAGVLEYRGIALEDLAERSTFIEVAYLLVYGELPKPKELERFRHDITYHTRLKYKILRMMEDLPETGHPMEFLQAVVSAMGMYYPARDTLNEEVRYWSIVRLIAKMPTIVAACHRLRHGDGPIPPRNDLSFAANFYYMLFEEEPTPLVEKILDVMLILHADHTMNASTFSARVVGSTLADPYTVISSAIGTLSGPLHGGANEQVLHMIDEIGSKDKVRAYIEAKLARHEKIMGIGHRVYKTQDPRGKILKTYIRKLKLFSERHIDPRVFEISEEIEHVVKDKLEAKRLYPNVDFYSGIVFRAMGIPTELYTPIFAMGRVAGWLAHWKEQLKTNRIFRPEQKYVGPRKQPYIPPEKRV
ncbi:MAG TPA: citrate synthase [Thermodesulfobacteriota bacterium]|nr:citrate synthase [Thermodesulfobacteriota bacterium]